MKALLWMLGALLSFCLMAVCARELSADITTYQVLFVRSLVGLVCVLLFVLVFKRSKELQTQRLGMHILRNVFHFGGQYGWFVGIALLPLAEVFALEFTVPIWTLIVASLFLRERITSSKVVAILLGFIGVIIILKPGLEVVSAASLIVLASAICYGIAHTGTKSLSSTESVVSVLFFMCIVQLPIGLVLSVSDWIWPTNLHWLYLLIVGLTALTGHMCFIQAMRHAEATTVVTIDFLRLPLIAIIGVWLYSEQLELSLMVGGTLMLIANLVSLKGASK